VATGDNAGDTSSALCRDATFWDIGMTEAAANRGPATKSSSGSSLRSPTDTKIMQKRQEIDCLLAAVDILAAADRP
jgi:hypothetical protein